MRPAGFWRRYAAYSLDLLAPLLLVSPWLWFHGRRTLAMLDYESARLELRMYTLMDQAVAAGEHPLRQMLAWTDDPVLRELTAGLAGQLVLAVALACLAIAAAAAPWFIGFEASRWQATPGKRLAGLQVVASDGSRPGLARVALRFFAGAPSWLLLHLGHALAAWTPDRRALHDYLAGTRVVLAPAAGAESPRWVRGWLWAQGLAFAAGVLTVASWYALLLQASL